MRLTVTFSADEPIVLPISYQHILQGLIYQSMRDKEFASFLHDSGYTAGNRAFKLFTFSLLSGKTKVDFERKMIAFYGPVRWQVGSAVPQFIRELGRSLLTSEQMHLLGQPVQIGQLTYEERVGGGTLSRVRMLSPLTVHSTFQTSEGKKVTQFYGPDDAVFAPRIQENMHQKYEACFHSKATVPFRIRPVNVGPQNRVVAKFDGFWVTAWNGAYEIEGSEDMIRLAFQVGLGARNSQGFGMIEEISSGATNTGQGGVGRRAHRVDDPVGASRDGRPYVGEGSHQAADGRGE